MSPIVFQQTPMQICQECGVPIVEQIESYLSECDRCLSKKAE